MVVPSLHTLPPELQCAVVEFLMRDADLCNVCLTSISLHAAALPKLYNNVTVDFSDCCYPNLSSFFTADSAGHRYVRSLYFDSCCDAPSDPEAALKTIKLAIQLLPIDSLEAFGMPEELAPDVDLLLLLGAQQRRLSELSLGGPIYSHLTEALNAGHCSLEWLTGLRSLAVPGSSVDLRDMQGYNQILRRARRLEVLSIDCSFENGGVGASLYETEASALGTLFGHIAPFGDSPAMELCALQLTNVELQYASQLFINVIDFLGLEELTILWCKTDICLLQSLTSLFKNGSNLRTFEWYGGRLEDGILEAFLNTCAPLTTLRLDYRTEYGGRAAFDYSCLRKHLATLKSLGLSIQTYDQSLKRITATLPQAALDMLTAHCSQLEELALGMPETVLSDITSRPAPDYKHTLVALSRCPALRFLRILNWPAAPESCFQSADDPTTGSKAMEELLLTRYSHLLNTFATSLLRLISVQRSQARFGRLLVLAFRENTGNTGSQWAFNKVRDKRIAVHSTCYIAGLQTDVYGTSEVIAVRKTCKEFKEIGGCVDIIDNS